MTFRANASKAAKRQRQYRARAKRREAQQRERWITWRRRVRPAPKEGDLYYGWSMGENFAYMSWRMGRAMRKSVDEWNCITPDPGGATECSQDNTSREVIVPVELRSASPEDRA